MPEPGPEQGLYQGGFKNARSFQQIFQLTDPDVFVDNHVSNGADYQHVVTLLSTQYGKLGAHNGRVPEKGI